MCISRSHMEISLPSSSVWAHLSVYPWRLASMWEHILTSSYCSRKASTSKHQSVYVTSAPGLVSLKISISNLVGTSLSSPYSLCSLYTYAGGLQSHLQWSIHQSLVPPVWERGGTTSSTNCSALGLQWPSVQLHCPHTGGDPCLSHLSHPKGSSGLLRCTSHQLARGVRLPCHSNWCIMDRVLPPTSQPSTLRGSN